MNLRLPDKVLHLLVFLIPFQRWELFGSPYYNVTFLTFFIYLFISIFDSYKNFSIEKLAIYLVPIIALVTLMFVRSYQYNFIGSTNAYSEVRQLLMQLVFFLLVVNAVKRNVSLEISLQKAFVFGVSFMAVLYFLGIGVETAVGRTTIFGINANALAFWYVLAILMILRFYIEQIFTSGVVSRFLALVPFFLLIVIYTGSRGGLLSLLSGAVFYLIFLPEKLERKLPVWISGAIAIAAGVLALLQTEIVQRRIQEQLKDPTYGGRLVIWEASYKLITDNLLFGVGASGFEKYIAQHLGRAWSPHNEYILILAYTGVVGMIAFVVFLTNLVKASISVRETMRTSFYIAILLVFVIYFYSTGGFITSFTFWFIPALAVGLQKWDEKMYRGYFSQKLST